MKNFARIALSLVTVSLLAGCAQQQANAPSGLLRQQCIMSNEPLDADSPTVDYMGGKLGFCCDKCLGKWNKLDDAGKKDAFEKSAAK
jgi:hypothetical protein